MKAFTLHIVHAVIMSACITTMFFVVNAVLSSFTARSPSPLSHVAMPVLSASVFGAFARRYYNRKSFLTAAILAGGMTAGVVEDALLWPLIAGGSIVGFMIPGIGKRGESNMHVEATPGNARQWFRR